MSNTLKMLGIVGILLAAACEGDTHAEEQFSITASGDTLILDGVIDTSTPEIVAGALRERPDIRVVTLRNIPGSDDDEANLELARMLRAAGVSTIIPPGGMVASGGTDLFLAGVTRVAAPDACIGVHSWAVSGFFGSEQGRDLPRDDPEHQLYLAYYREMGIHSDFYWYTLNSADADHIHWMNASEINSFGLTTTPVRSGETLELTQRRCNVALNE
ncbi:alpha/beta hydrolase [Roseovarius sp. 2305UL8-3]|uniref:COG3904 family protein n=1 Tax=Roseovarius conchicola TaxID=3121636 RepID=UPI0035274BF5